MATQTLAEAGKLVNDDLVSGIVEDIVTTDAIFSAIPWTGYEGQAMIVNREETLGDAEFLAIGGNITAKTQSSYATATYTATTIIGDAEINGLVQAQSSSAGVDQLAVEVSSKAKNIGRMIKQGIATGNGSAPQMNSINSLVDPSQFVTASAGRTLSFEEIDELLDLVKSKDGEVDWIMMNGKTIRQYKALVRQLGGVNETMAFTMPNGTTRTVSVYEGIPVFQNDYIPSTETANGASLTGGTMSSVYAGVFDDGTSKVGVSMIHPIGVVGGIIVDPIGQKEGKDERIVRIKSYCNFASFNRRGVARLASIT